jgi:ribosome-binding protein aMBF1 (putative translation factor)
MDTNARTAYASAIREARKGRNQGEIAAACPPSLGVYQSRISEWERGAGVPSTAQAIALHDALGMTEEQKAEAVHLLTEADAERLREANEARKADRAAPLVKSEVA